MDGYTPHQSKKLTGGNVATYFNIFTNKITIKKIDIARDDNDPIDTQLIDNMYKLIEVTNVFENKYPTKETIHNVLSFPTMILTKSTKESLDQLFNLFNRKDKNINELKQLIDKQYFKNYFGSVSVYEFIYVMTFVGFHKKDNILFISSDTNFMHGFIEYVNNKYENKYDIKNILFLRPHDSHTLDTTIVDQYHVPYHQMLPFTDDIDAHVEKYITKKYHVVTLDVQTTNKILYQFSVNYAYSTIFVTIYMALLSLEINGKLIMYVPYIGKKYIFDMICDINKMFKKQAIFKENAFAPPESIYHIIVFKGFKMNQEIINSLKIINKLNYELDNTYGNNFNISSDFAAKYGISYDKNKIPYQSIKIISDLKDEDYAVYKKFVNKEINKSIVKITNSMQMIASDKLNLDDLVKITKMNYDYSINIIKNKFSDINIMHPFVWEKTDSYMLDIFDSIEKEDVKGHMYIIESRKSDIVDDEYINIVKKQLRFINEYTYQYVSKSNYKKYKQAELFFNSEYKVLNKKLAIEYDITINGNYVSRAWMKMYEMIIQCNFVESFGNKITGFHICEAPGNFINAMIYHIGSKNKQYEWHAQSLNPDLPGNKDAFMDEYGFIKKTKKNWDFGVDNTGDILNLENFKYYIDKYKGVDVLIGDCGEQWTGEKKKKWPDQVDSPIRVKIRDLGTCQMLYALNIPRQGGNCIIKTYSGNLDPVFLTLLELMVSSYSKIIFFKSNLNFWSAEVYIVGINFLGPSEDIKNMTNDFINGNISELPKISRYTFSQYVNLSEKILHQVFMYKTFFVISC